MATSVTPSKREANESLLNNLSKAQTSSKYTDLTLRCEEKEFKVHRIVVCGWSPVIASACDGRFQESDTRVMNVSIATAAAVERMVDFMYSADYNDKAAAVSEDPPKNDESATIDMPDPTMVANIEVYVLADYYRIESLRKLATEKFNAACNRPLSKEDILATAREVYSNSHPPLADLRNIIASRAASPSMRDILLEDSSFMNDAEELDGFVADMTRSLNRQYKGSIDQCKEYFRDAIQITSKVCATLGGKTEPERKKLAAMHNRLTAFLGQMETKEGSNQPKSE